MEGGIVMGGWNTKATQDDYILCDLCERLDFIHKL